ncbi:hypothetical protein BT246_28580 [Bacillus thuringiensis]|uniref:Uncharacterized protein n=1 Tax=Bacillus thuringiensis TaxID=1428 RepID=A0A9W3X0P3_BACTU|nr:hypothetical protein BT246_28580 [Bacillus thuringiensis]
METSTFLGSVLGMDDGYRIGNTFRPSIGAT